MRRARTLVLALAAALLVAAGCGGEETTGRAGADVGHGKELFTQTCGQCHALADAGTSGQIGPNLDQAFGYSRQQGFEESTFYDIVRRQIDIPALDGGMPADLVQGQDAVDVAAYVARVAGTGSSLEGGGGGGQEGGGETDGKSIFATNCGSCHTLADAGTSGNVGPNLDESQPPVDLVVDRVTNGKGAMPSFADTLSEEQIQAVSEYVSSAAGG